MRTKALSNQNPWMGVPRSVLGLSLLSMSSEAAANSVRASVVRPSAFKLRARINRAVAVRGALNSGQAIQRWDQSAALAKLARRYSQRPRERARQEDWKTSPAASASL